MSMKMKTDKCAECGGVVFKLAGKAARVCHDKCLKCRAKAQASHPPQHQRNR